MRFSEDISLLLPAMDKVQTLIDQPKKNKKAYNYFYADLAAYMVEVIKACIQCGLRLFQGTGGIGETYGLYTRVVHISSGQWVELFIPMDAKAEPQDMGSAMTYFRRYSINNIFNLVGEEDIDGAKPSNKSNVSGSNATSKPFGATNIGPNKPTTNSGSKSQNPVGIPAIPLVPSRPAINAPSINKPDSSNAEKVRAIKKTLTAPQSQEFSFGIEPSEEDVPF